MSVIYGLKEERIGIAHSWRHRTRYVASYDPIGPRRYLVLPPIWVLQMLPSKIRILYVSKNYTKNRECSWSMSLQHPKMSCQIRYGQWETKKRKSAWIVSFSGFCLFVTLVTLFIPDLSFLFLDAHFEFGSEILGGCSDTCYEHPQIFVEFFET